jgi:hypothetical protein
MLFVFGKHDKYSEARVSNSLIIMGRTDSIAISVEVSALSLSCKITVEP